MKKIQLLICLALIIGSVYTYTEIDQITISVKTLAQITQSDLSNATSEALSWGNTAAEFYSCSNLSNKYYSTINNTFTLQKSWSSISTHDYVYISFDTVFLNVEKVLGGIEKHAQIEIDGTDYTFSANVNNDYYGCMKQSTSSKRDGQGTASILLSHTSTTMTIKIKTLDLGSVARLGIANLKITTAHCGANTSFNTSTLQCECKTGYSAQLQGHGSPGHVYYDKVCVAN